MTRIHRIAAGRIRLAVGLMAIWGVFLGTEQTLYAENDAETEKCGYVEIPDTVYSIYDGTETPEALNAEELPDAYDAREAGVVTSVKNQSPWGNCWSFATLTALESSMLSEQVVSDEPDLSEYHLCWYNAFSVEDPLGGTAGDSVAYQGTISESLENGGNTAVAFHALANWIGAADEEDYAYPVSDPEELPLDTESAYLNDVVHLQQTWLIKLDDTAAVKTEIMNYGAVTASIYYNQKYLNKSTGGYYNNKIDSSNHAVAIVGWDDNYSRDNFSAEPESDGAWLVKNSWGEDFGLDGYMWISYEDISWGETVCVLRGENADNYDHNYQYDGSYMNTYLSSKESTLLTAANIFTVPAGETNEALRAVSFEIGTTNIDYSIQIYTDLEDVTAPDSGRALLSEPVTGTAVYQGYYTVALPETVMLNPGETFAVVIEFESEKEGARIVVLERSTIWNGAVYTASAQAGQSYMRVGTNSAWQDVGTKYSGNVRIKAFTDETDETPVWISLEPSETDLTVGESVTLSLSRGSEDLTQDADGYLWSSDDEAVATVTEEGVVTGVGQGSCTITCRNPYNELDAATVTIQIRSSFEDILTTDWQYPYVMTVYQTGIMTGKSSAMFGMNDLLTRAEFVTMLYAYADKPKCIYGERFSDVLQTDWYALPVTWAYVNGVTAGYGDRFGAADSITREQLVQMLYRYAQSLDGDMTADADVLDGYDDVGEVSDYAVEAMRWAVTNGMISGRGTQLAPAGQTTRGECATIMTRFMERLSQ